MNPILVFVYVIVLLLLGGFFFWDIIGAWGAANAAQTTGIEKLFWSTANIWLYWLPLAVFAVVGIRSGDQ